MPAGINNPAKLAYADPVRWPLQIRQSHYGWTVTVYNQDGHARHILTVDSEMEAYREARNLSKIYRVSVPAYAITFKGEMKVDLERLLRHRHKG